MGEEKWQAKNDGKTENYSEVCGEKVSITNYAIACTMAEINEKGPV